jgi:hypothetical protein
MDFERDFLPQVREVLGGRRVRFSQGVVCENIESAGAVTLRVTVPTAFLCENMQDDRAAAPTFALAMAYWFEKATGIVTNCELTIEGDAPSAGDGL